MVGDELEVENSASKRSDPAKDLEAAFSNQVAKLSNKPLQLTRACQLSVDGQRAGAARFDLMKAAAARPRQCYYRRTPNGPCS